MKTALTIRINTLVLNLHAARKIGNRDLAERLLVRIYTLEERLAGLKG